MKKILSIVVSLILMISLCMTANAASGTASLNGNSSVTVGSNIVLTVKVSGCADATSVSANVSFGDNFEYVSASWIKSGMINNPYDTSTGKGALGGLTSPNINGDLYQLTLKAKTASTSNQTVSIIITAKNGSSEIFNSTASKSIKINCKTHSYGTYSKVDNNNHQRTCSACGDVEKKAHTWNGGETTKPANCKEGGNIKYTCTACHAEKNTATNKTNNHNFSAWTVKTPAKCTTKGTETRTCSVCNKVESRDINALGHSFSSPVVTQKPTCTETGVETGTCTRCKQTTTNTIKALGHKFGAWTKTADATCTAAGTEQRVCSTCQKTETRNTDALGHDFESPTIVKEPTISQTGLKEGKCKRCGETTSEVIPCTAKDETTGVVIEALDGTFAEGTTVQFNKVDTSSANYENVKNALAQYGTSFAAFGITFESGNVAAEPTGEYTVTLPNTEKLTVDTAAVYLISADGVAAEKEFKINEDGTISVKSESSGTFAVVNKSSADTLTPAPDTDTTPDPIDQDDDFIIWIILGVVAAVVIAGGTVAVLIIKKKKKAQ